MNLNPIRDRTPSNTPPEKGSKENTPDSTPKPIVPLRRSRTPSDIQMNDPISFSPNMEKHTRIVDQISKKALWFANHVIAKDTYQISYKNLSPRSRLKQLSNFVKALVFNLSIPFHRNSKGMAKALTNLELFYKQSSQPFPLFVKAAIAQAQADGIPLYEINLCLIEYFKMHLYKDGYVHIYALRKRESLAEKWRRLLPSWESDCLSRAIAQEIMIRKNEKLSKKAAEIVYHLLNNSLFDNTPLSAMLKICALRCGKMRNPKRDTEKLSTLLMLPLGELTEKMNYTDPYQDHQLLLTGLSKYLSEMEYSTFRSLREEVADALHLILNRKMREMANGEMIQEQKQNHLKLMHFINLSYCSKHFITYEKWHQKTFHFFRVESSENIAAILKPLEESSEVIKSLISKNNQGQRATPSEVEVFESTFFKAGHISLELMQSFFDARISLRMDWERSADKSSIDYGQLSDQNLTELFLSPQEPWQDFLTKYLEYSKSEVHLPSHLNFKKLLWLRQESVGKVYSDIVEKAWEEWTQKQNSNKLTIARDPKEKIDEYINALDQLNHRRFLFSKKMRMFLKTTIPGSCLEKMFFEKDNVFVNPLPSSFELYKDAIAEGFKRLLLQAANTLSNLPEKQAFTPQEKSDVDFLRNAYLNKALDKSLAKDLVSYLTLTLEELEGVKRELTEKVNEPIDKAKKDEFKSDQSEDPSKMKPKQEKQLGLICSLSDIHHPETTQNINKIITIFSDLFFMSIGTENFEFDISQNSRYVSTLSLPSIFNGASSISYLSTPNRSVPSSARNMLQQPLSQRTSITETPKPLLTPAQPINMSSLQIRIPINVPKQTLRISTPNQGPTLKVDPHDTIFV